VRSPVGRNARGRVARYNAVMTDRIRLIKHEAGPQCGSFEVRFADGRESRFFYWDDLPSRRLRPETLTLEAAKALARAERDKAAP
jgi:hypothetical protein